MSKRYRVFGRNTVQPEPAMLIKLFKERGVEVQGNFHGDNLGWYKAEFVCESGRSLLKVERYLAEEEGIRQQFSTWAAWIESANNDPAKEWLMERIINTRQMFTIEPLADHDDEEERVRDLCNEVARFCARVTDGIYQIDDQGIFAADGTLLLEEF